MQSLLSYPNFPSHVLRATGCFACNRFFAWDNLRTPGEELRIPSDELCKLCDELRLACKELQMTCRVAKDVQRVANGVQRVALHWACDKLPFSSATEEKQNINRCHQTININTRYNLIIPKKAK